jgi:hypothetical protein
LLTGSKGRPGFVVAAIMVQRRIALGLGSKVDVRATMAGKAA